MSFSLFAPLTAKDGRTHRVILPARVSCPSEGKQDIRAPGDQEAMLRKCTVALAQFPVDYTVTAGSGSGEYFNRKEFLRLLELIETGDYDAVIVEDLGRIARRVRTHEVCETCIDYSTRLISINDNVDTAQPG